MGTATGGGTRWEVRIHLPTAALSSKLSRRINGQFPSGSSLSHGVAHESSTVASEKPFPDPSPRSPAAPRPRERPGMILGFGCHIQVPYQSCLQRPGGQGLLLGCPGPRSKPGRLRARPLTFISWFPEPAFQRVQVMSGQGPEGESHELGRVALVLGEAGCGRRKG
jgi:hypothetical protein